MHRVHQPIFQTLLLIPLLLICTAHPAAAEDEDIAAIFASRGLTGTMVIKSKNTATTFVHNDSRAAQRFLPASTFKIPNTLLALRHGAIANERQELAWNGQKRGLRHCRRDMTLTFALPNSCVWFYREMARRIGANAYRQYLAELDYGNRKIGTPKDMFWLTGDLRISAWEQIELLKHIEERKFDFDRSHYDVLADLMRSKKPGEQRLYEKTGWANQRGNEVGWYVGYIKTTDDVWTFATNMLVRNRQDAAHRKPLTLEVLALKGIL